MALSPALGNFDILDPTREAKRVCTNLSLTFDKWVELSDEHKAALINAVHADTITKWELLDPQAWATKVQAITV